MKLLPLLSLAAFAAAWLPQPVRASDLGKRFPSEMKVYSDKVTGVPMTFLTTNLTTSDSKIYQDHPQWTADGQYIIFRSDGRAASGGTQAFAVNEKTGEIIQLTDGTGNNTGTLNIARKSMKLYFLRNLTTPTAADQPVQNGRRVQLIELNLEKLLADSAAKKMQPDAAYERVVATLPAGMGDSGGFALDANEDYAYLGVRGGDTGTHLPPGMEVTQTQPGQRMGGGPGGLRSINIKTGEIKVIIDTPFNMGHVQTNPWVPGEIVYCHETGGDAPQRTWTVHADGTGNRPLYVETPDEWITHEAIITPDEVAIAILGHQPKLRTKPTGVGIVNLRTGVMKIAGQVELDSTPTGGRVGGIWHVNGSSDGRWAVADTFAGNIYLMDRRSGETTLLSTDHKMTPDHAHPTFRPDNKEILIQSGILSGGETLDLVILPVPKELANREPALKAAPTTTN